MILKIIPFLLIIIPVVGFFYTPEYPQLSNSSGGKQAIAELAYFLFTIPWWGKILSILVGLIWLLGGSDNDE